jgi:putative ABC transport system substrate-binding protein
VAQAQQPAKVPRIGVLLSGSRSSTATNTDAFRQALREPGYVEGQNIAIEYQYADGKVDRLAELAAVLVGVKVDVLIAGGGNIDTRITNGYPL